MIKGGNGIIPEKEGRGGDVSLFFLFLFLFDSISHGRLEVCLSEAKKVESNFGLGLLCVNFFSPVSFFHHLGREEKFWVGEGWDMEMGETGRNKETRERGDRDKIPRLSGELQQERGPDDQMNLFGVAFLVVSFSSPILP